MSRLDQRIIIVLGMHRSGTSVITRGLQVLGVDLGNNLIGGIAENNEKGFWEDAEINGFNNSLLEKLGSAWDRLNAIDDTTLLGEKFAQERREAVELLKGKLPANSIFAFKDPRTAILLPFWQQVFEALELSPGYLVAVRNPMEVAESLLRRDKMPLLKGMLLWTKYSVAAVRNSQSGPRVFVSYSAMMRDPLAQLLRISRALDLPTPESNPDGMFEYTEEFLSPELRHSVSSVDALLAPGQIPPFISNFYRVLVQLAGDQLLPQSVDFAQIWPDMEKHYADFVPLLNQFDQMEQEAWLPREEAAQHEQNMDIGQIAQSRSPHFRTLRTFIDHLGAVYSDFGRLIHRWNLESIHEGRRLQSAGGHMMVSGWVVGKTPSAVHVATRQDGVTRCYPLNVERSDVIQVVLGENPSLPVSPICGFQYALESDSAFDIGFEVDGWIFWLYSGEPAMGKLAE